MKSIRKIHWEWRPGMIWCRAHRTGNDPARSAKPEEVTCLSCRRHLEAEARREASRP